VCSKPSSKVIHGCFVVAVPNVWKVFSQNPLSQIELKKLFSEVKESHVVDWLAYPHYNVPESQAVSR
jgi:prenylcysteine oxidase/farnesylcysteine lyase